MEPTTFITALLLGIVMGPVLDLLARTNTHRSAHETDRRHSDGEGTAYALLAELLMVRRTWSHHG